MASDASILLCLFASAFLFACEVRRGAPHVAPGASPSCWLGRGSDLALIGSCDLVQVSRTLATTSTLSSSNLCIRTSQCPENLQTYGPATGTRLGPSLYLEQTFEAFIYWHIADHLIVVPRLHWPKCAKQKKHLRSGPATKRHSWRSSAECSRLSRFQIMLLHNCAYVCVREREGETGLLRRWGGR